MKTKTAPSPATTAEACAKYGARAWECNCPDRVNRGGSHFDERTKEACCKHMLAIRTGLVDSNEVRCIERGITPEQLTAECVVLIDRLKSGPDVTPKPVAAPALNPQHPAFAVAPKAPVAKPAPTELETMQANRRDMARRLDEVQSIIALAQPGDEDDYDYQDIQAYMHEADDLWAALEEYDLRIDMMIQAEAETAQADIEFETLIAEVNDDLDDTLTPEELVALMAGRKAERKAGTAPKRNIDPTGILTPAKPASATDALLAAIIPQLQGRPIRRHG